jgi:peptide subunit release factor 1 (eRF1)
LKLEKNTPPNGTILLCGEFDSSSLPFTSLINSSECLLFFEPPLPVKRYFYFCDKRFHLDDIIDMYKYNEEKEKKYGICVVRGTDAKVYHYTPSVSLLQLKGSSSSAVRNKHGRGGFSQNRYQRLREGDVHAMCVRVVETCEGSFLDENRNPAVEMVVFVVMTLILNVILL